MRQRPGGKRRGGKRSGDDQHLGSNCRSCLDVAFLSGRQSQHPGDRNRNGGRSGSGNPGLRLCYALGCYGCRRRSRAPFLLCDAFRERRKLDESLDVWACHGMASSWGTIATGLFATVAVNAGGPRFIFGNPGQLSIQILAVIVTIVFSFGMTYVLAKALNMSIGLRVSPMEEEVGWISVPTEKIILLDHCLHVQMNNI